MSMGDVGTVWITEFAKEHERHGSPFASFVSFREFRGPNAPHNQEKLPRGQPTLHQRI